MLRFAAASIVCLAGLLAPHQVRAQAVPEPETIFYGKVVNKTSGQNFPMTVGTLAWTITGDAGKTLTLTTQLGEFANGAYSYIVKVPHQAQSLGLVVTASGLPLSSDTKTLQNTNMTVDGHPAKILTADGSTFTASQPLRANAHRLDLEVFDSLVDTDHDGIPDWWEDKYGLNKQLASDALLHHGNNRLSYLEDFLLGIDPNLDDSATQLLTHSITVLEGGSTGVLLKTFNSVALPAELKYTLGTPPLGGMLVLRNSRKDPKMPHRTLRQGDTFTQEAVDAGLLEYVHTNQAVKSASFHVSITDGNATHAAVEGDVAVTVYKPDAVAGSIGERWLQSAAGTAPPVSDTAAALWRRQATAAFPNDWVNGAAQKNRITAYLLSKWYNYSVWDLTAEQPARNLALPSSRMTKSQYTASYVPVYGAARNQVVLGSTGISRVEGGMGNDILVAGNGQTAFAGNGGADIFVFGPTFGAATVEDFKSADGDVIDVSGLLTGTSVNLTDFVQVNASGADTILDFNAAGTGGTYADGTLILKNLVITADGLKKLWVSGNFFTGRSPGATPPPNRAPVAVADRAFVTSGLPVTIPVLANDTDADGDILTLTSVGAPSFGFAQIVDRSVVYTPGYRFAGADSLTYAINDGRGGKATGTITLTYPAPPAGSYAPLLLDADGRPVGQVTITLTANGSFTVTITTAAGKVTGTGKFDANGIADVELGAAQTALSLHLVIDMRDPAHGISGTVYGSGEDLTVAADTMLASGAVVPGMARNLTLVMDAPAAVPGVTGRGFAIITVSNTYVVSIAGRIADGTPFMAGTTLRNDGSLQCSAILNKNLDWVVATLSLNNSPAVPAGGSMRWFKRNTVHGPYAPPLLDQTLPTIVSPYIPPSLATSHALDFTSPDAAPAVADLHLKGGSLTAAGADKVIQFAASDVIKVNTPLADPLKLTLARASGLLTGTTTINGVAHTVVGVVLQDENRGDGLFFSGASPGASAGSLEIIPR